MSAGAAGREGQYADVEKGPRVKLDTRCRIEIADLRTKAHLNLALGLCSVIYMGVNIVCLVLNGYDKDGPDPVMTPHNFHKMEFGATFLFNIVQVIAMLYSPKDLGVMYSNPTFVKLIIVVNVGVSFMSAALVFISLEEFEVPSHEMEYANEVTMSLMDLILLVGILRHIDGKLWARDNMKAFASTGLAVTAFSIACVQLGIYNLMGWDESGDSKGEVLAHYFEFSFEVVSSIITFWFCMTGRVICEQRVKALLGPGTDQVALTSPRSDESSEDSEP